MVELPHLKYYQWRGADVEARQYALTVARETATRSKYDYDLVYACAYAVAYADAQGDNHG